MLDILALTTTATANLTVCVLSFHLVGKARQTAAIGDSLRCIQADVEAMRIAHDHYAHGTDRRLENVEAAAAEAAQEARIVSVQLGEIADTLNQRRVTTGNGRPPSSRRRFVGSDALAQAFADVPPVDGEAMRQGADEFFGDDGDRV